MCVVVVTWCFIAGMINVVLIEEGSVVHNPLILSVFCHVLSSVLVIHNALTLAF